MFTGIIECTAPILSVQPLYSGRLARIKIRRPDHFEDVKPGDSIAVNGVCLTVESEGLSPDEMQFALGEETLNVTALSTLSVGESVNLERSAKIGDRVHGHNVLGHVDATCKVLAVQDLPDNQGRLLSVAVSSAYHSFIWPKASWALNGVSLTVNRLTRQQREPADSQRAGALSDSTPIIVEHCLIPETLKLTNLGSVQAGDLLNFEVDTMAKAIHQSVIAYLEHRTEMEKSS